MTIERWTDEKLDRLSESVSELRESVSELRESVSELRSADAEFRTSVSESKIIADQLIESNARAIQALNDELRPYMNALMNGQIIMQELIQNHDVQIKKSEADQVKRDAERDAELARVRERQIESDQRFYILLQELRHQNSRNNPELG